METVNNKIENIYPLTPLQYGMLFHNLYEKESGAYVIQMGLKTDKDMNPEMLQKALQLLADKHTVLRTLFVHQKVKEACQVVLKERAPEFEYIDLSDKTSDIQDNLIKDIFSADLKRGFDLQKDTLIRLKCVKISDKQDMLIFSNHHIIMDGWCNNILLRELFGFYDRMCNGETYDALLDEISKSKKNSFDYGDYLKWLGNQDKDRARDYWEKELEGYDNDSYIKPMYKPEATKEQVRRCYTELSSDVTHKLEAVAGKAGSTINTLAETAVGIMLQTYTGSNDVVFGKVVSGRNADIPGIENMVGLFINTIPLRVTTDKDMTVTDLLKKQQIKSIESTNYDYYSLSDIQSMTLQGSDLIKVLYVFENYTSGLSSEENDNCGITVENTREQTNYSLTISGHENDGKLCFDIMYDPGEYHESEVILILDRLKKICEEIAEKSEHKVCELETITEKEKHLILDELGALDACYPKNKNVVDLFEKQVRKTPDNIAVVFEDEQLTYKELNEKADRLAGTLIKKGIEPGDYVGMFIERSLEMIIGIYGIIKAGGVYVPINTMYPDDRVEYILKDCGAKLLLVGKTELNIDYSGERLDLYSKDTYGDPITVKPVISPQNGIYVIYTSGTTGMPKGVEVMHKNVVRLMFNDHFDYDFNENDVWTMFHSYGFDFSVWEMYGATLYGGKLIVVSEEDAKDSVAFLSLLRKHKVTVLNQVPTAFYNLLDADNGDKLYVRYLIFGGEALKPERLKKWRKFHPQTKIVNMYGITETTVHVTYREIGDKEIERGLSDIGRAIPTLKVYILNNNTLCGIGVNGEICVTGEGVAAGYLNRPELTEKKFVKNPFGEGRMYRSGDLARWLPDGNIEYLGRIDEQVKIRGFRIELGEIESRIREVEGIKDCAVIAKSDSSGEKAIYAYYTSDNDIETSYIRERLGKNMPEYMIPAYMMQIDRLPVTRNGKLDRSLLPDIKSCNIRKYVAPRNETEKKLCSLFEEILEVEHVGIYDNFFELGGHSLKATRLVNCFETETGIRIPLKDIFSNSTPEQLALLAGEKNESYAPIPKANDKEYYPMSSAQKRMYYINQMQPDTTAYNIPFAVRITGELDVTRFADAVRKLIDSNEILRTSFHVVDSVPVQKIHESVDVDFEYVAEKKSTDEQLIASFVKPFDLSVPKLIRIKLYERGDYKIMLIDMHHIISDGMSIYNLVSELSDYYSGGEASSDKLQFKDYSEWCNNIDFSEHEKFWKDMFSGEIPVIDIPTDHTRPSVQQYNGAKTEIRIDREKSRNISDFVTAHGVTEYMFFMSALMIMLSKYSRQDDIIIGSPITGRTHKDTEKMIGMFVNTIAMRGNPAGDKKYKDFLEDIRTKCLEAYEYQDYPFEELIDKLDIERDMSKNPLFDVMFAYQNFERPSMKLGNADMDVIEISENNTKFDLTFSISEINGSYDIILEYSTDIYNADSAENMLSHLTALIDDIMSSPDNAISEIEMISPKEKDTIVNKFNDTTVDYPSDSNVAEALICSASKTPEKIAVVCNNESITYAELDRRSNIIANKLKEYNVSRDDFVIVMARKCIETIVGICGIVKAGGAYVPIDPSYPEERINFIVDDCKPKAIIRFSDMQSISKEIPNILIDSKDLFVGDTTQPEIAATPDSLIYCIYTSGTTGKPKGVLIEHISVMKLVFNCDYTELNENSRIIQTGQLSFDASTFEIWGALLNGGTLFLAEQSILLDAQELKKYLIDNRINTMFITTALFNQLLDDDSEVFNSLEHLLFGGEATSERHVEKLRNQHTVPDFRNVYGPTETTTFAAHYIIDHYAEKTPIGKPISNTRMYIIDAGHLCGIGLPGELCIAGDGLARGYLNRPDLTDEKFIYNEELGKRIYRSGDLARWLPDGNIEYLGRVDDQIKIRGFRIELGEIENIIRGIEGVKDCVVIVRNDHSGDKAIYAYYTSTTDLSADNLRDSLSSVLPNYMVPSYIMCIDELPFTGNGKVDKNRLPDIDSRIVREYEAPINEAETVLCGAMASILNLERVGRSDRFFEIGGDSIKAIRVVTLLKKEGYELHVKDIMRSEDMRVIAANMKKVTSEMNSSQECVTGNVKFMPAVSMFRDFDLERPEYFHQSAILKCNGNIDISIAKEVLDLMTRQHDALRAVYSNGELYIREYEKGKMFTFGEYTVADLSEIPDICDKLRSCTDIENGNMMTAAVFNHEKNSYLFIAVHHLVVDGISWRILLNDIIDAYDEMQKQGRVVLPYKTASLIEWDKKLEEYIESEKFRSAKEFWYKELDDICDQYIPTKKVGHGGNVIFSLTQKQTDDLVYNANHAYNTDVRDLLLAALAETLKEASDKDSTVIGLENYGRNSFDESIDTNRTVGWFTALYPLNIRFSDDISSQIVSVKEKLREINGHELDYSLMRFITKDIDEISNLICWNYHGIVDEQNMSEKELILSDTINTGNGIASENDFLSPIIINLIIVSGVLKVEIIYKDVIGKEEVQTFADSYKNNICAVIAHCTEAENDFRTISDFDVELDDADDINDLIESLSF